MNKINSYFLITITSVILMTGCKGPQQDTSGKPGPVTESDKSRYNLNPTDELRYGTLDSANQDSTDTSRDSVQRNKE